MPPIMDTLKQKAKAAGLWNLFLPDVGGMTNLEYGVLAGIMVQAFIAYALTE